MKKRKARVLEKGDLKESILSVEFNGLVITEFPSKMRMVVLQKNGLVHMELDALGEAN